MKTIDRRVMLSAMAAALGAGCANTPNPTNSSAETPAPPPLPAATALVTNTETVVLKRPGVLIRLEGLIAYSVLADGPRNTEVDALLLDATANKELALHAHIPTIGIPRDVLDPHVIPVAVDLDYAYWPIGGRTLTIGPRTITATTIAFSDQSPKFDPTQKIDNEMWRSTGWLADLLGTYPGYALGPYRPAATVSFQLGVEFEPDKILYGEADKANGTWDLWDAKIRKAEARPYKHSLHAFFEDPKGIAIGGLLPGGKPLIVLPSKEIRRPIRISHLPGRALSKEEIAATKDARVYADLLSPPVPIAQRVYPKYVARAWRTDECGCCPQFRFARKPAARSVKG